MYGKVTKSGEICGWIALIFALFLLLDRYILLAGQSCGDVYGAPFGGVNPPPGKFIAFQTQADHVGASGNLDAGRGELAGRDAVD